MKRGVTIGLDIGSNSVGSAWVDEDKQEIEVGCSVFPAGVEDSDKGRGAPKNQDRRQKRSARRNIARRSQRKRNLRKFLIEVGLLPRDRESAEALFRQDPWQVRRLGLTESLTPHQFGRVLLHLAQRRGAAGLRPVVEEDAKPANDSDGPIKEAIDETRKKMLARGCHTFGQLIADIAEEQAVAVNDQDGKPKRNANNHVVKYQNKIRNSTGEFLYHADREMIRDEFRILWEKQKERGGELATLLTDEVRLALDDPTRDETWRHRGLMFGQRKTYWDVGTLGRCDLEPSDRVAPLADCYASRFRVIEYVNNIRIQRPGETEFQPLSQDEHAAIVERLGKQKTATISTVRQALKIDTKSLKKSNFSTDDFVLNLERDEQRPPNTDWFACAIALPLEQAGHTDLLSSTVQLAKLNKAILRFDPAEPDDEARLRNKLVHLKLSQQGIDAVIEGWRTRPKLENRLKLSRRAIRNLLPYMEQRDSDGHWRTQNEARCAFADDEHAADSATGKPPTDEQRKRYRLGRGRLNSAARHYLKKHPEEYLPLPPVLSNPVVRKAIYEVRRHIIAYLKKHDGRRPDRIVIEFAREATKPAIVNDRMLARNRNRDQIRRQIRESIIRPAWGAKFDSLTTNQIKAAETRVLLCLQQRGVCAYSLESILDDDNGMCGYSGRSITPRQAALGTNLEVDHIVPYSRCGDNSMNNKVLCYIDSNRDKGNRTLREWWDDQFDERIKPMRFFENARPAKGDYFEVRDYTKKWRNLSADKVPKEWQGSQLSDTAYAAREVQEYLEAALWPEEPGHLEGGRRRIFVTRGGHTARLRRDWQLYRQAAPHELPLGPDEQERRDAKNRGDHREHAIDAVIIALTSESRLQKMAKDVNDHNDAWTRARRTGQRPKQLRRKPLPPPWGDVQSFRQQVISLIYPTGADESSNTPLVVSHRAVGRKLSGQLHEESLFGPVAQQENTFIAKKAIGDLTPKHLRMQVAEKPNDAIARLAKRYQQADRKLSAKDAKARAKNVVEGRGYQPRMGDPSPEKSGLIRDIGLRRVLRKQITERAEKLGIPRDADSFTKSDLKKMLAEPFGPFRQESGVPIKSFRLLRTMNGPVVMSRREFDYEMMQWTQLDSKNKPTSPRAHLSGNNHHLEIRRNLRGKWVGTVVSMYEAAHRAKKLGVDPVDRSCDDDRGTYVMSLAIGETVYMRDKETDQPGYFVVTKLDSESNRVFLCAHWDARRSVGEKNESGLVTEGTKRRTLPYPPSKMQSLAPPGYDTPVKISVSPIGQITVVEPHEPRTVDLDELDAEVVAIAREAIAARKSRNAEKRRGRRCYGSWTWMRERLRKCKKEHLAADLSAVMRAMASGE
ncbi:CRISPR-associated endonuclease Csn1 [Rhodopirellula rubra]|uniref:CRISPR-associated endonuclease Cas9 n=1 Tax=Aporhodopirellula rubra TaxID=980271 RepID=A0A7W5H6G6_9BACT|nr:type II CRISPR RNA-guided endonuclease Cas9 [Aporhodopirellula rubra]MBB3207444.1 CRISPR-associated endonuclease Csn1 [Aporhodopirellula rubra]